MVESLSIHLYQEVRVLVQLLLQVAVTWAGQSWARELDSRAKLNAVEITRRTAHMPNTALRMHGSARLWMIQMSRSNKELALT